ncbi:MAG: hypothetical protein ABIT36_09080 [Steroidobacteraceae bacterium]
MNRAHAHRSRRVSREESQEVVLRLPVPPTGIEVCEEELTLIKAQLMYRMRCDCGRSWFDLRLPQLAECPSCTKKGMVVV